MRYFDKKFFLSFILSSLPFYSMSTIEDSLSEKINKLEESNKKVQAQQAFAIAQQRQEIESLKKQLGQTETTQKIRPGYIPVPGTDISVKIFGYAKAVGIYDSTGNATGICTDYLYPPGISLDTQTQSKRSKQFRMQARESRIGIEGVAPLGNRVFEDIHGSIVLDFFSAASEGSNELTSNSYYFRVREAFLESGPIIFGHTFSAFDDMSAMPETVDLHPAGECYIRQPQLRYTHKLNDFKIIGSLENPDSDYLLPNGKGDSTPNDRFGTNGIDRIPDIILSLIYEQKWGHLSGRVIYRRIGVSDFTNIRQTLAGVPGGDVDPAVSIAGGDEDDDSVTLPGSGKEASNTSAHASAFGGYLSGVYYFYEKDKVMLQVCSGKGLGRYMIDSIYSSAFFNGSKLRSISSHHASIGFQHFWAPTLRSSICYSILMIKNPSELQQWFTNNPVIKKTMTFNVNLFWSPFKPVDIGLEYIHAERHVEGGVSGKLNRICLGGKFSF